jgi:hypothetical protein
MIHRVYLGVGIAIVVILMGVACLEAADDIPTLVIADFNAGDKPNNVGGDFGSWNYAPNDETQGCWDSFEPADYAGKDGYSIVMEYDVKSPNPAFCGFWMKLGGSDVTNFDTLSLRVKGDEKTGYTSRFKIELRNKQGGRAVFTLSGVDGTWQEFNIPVKRTKSIKDWSKMEEFTIVFDDILATKKTGKIYVDEIAFKKLSTDEIQAPPVPEPSIAAPQASPSS